MAEGIGIVVAGFGYWGANLARNVEAVPSTDLVGILDSDEGRRHAAGTTHRHARVWSSLGDALADDDVRAVILATPASTHAAMASEALKAGRHVLVEKPLAETVADADELIELARAYGLTLMVGHTFLYSAPVRMLRSWVQEGELGHVRYLHSRRLSLGRIRRDCNALWNFAPHDLSIMMYLLNDRPVEVTSRGFAFIQPDIEDVCFGSLGFESGVGASLHVSWIDPLKIRNMTVVGDEKMAVYNDVSVDQPLALVDSGVARDHDLGEYLSLGDFQWRTRAGDILIPRIEMTEPLFEEISAFGHACQTGEPPTTDGHHGRDVVKVLVALEESMRKSGTPVEIQW